jgi:glucokinase
MPETATIGVDIGGTKTLCVLANSKGRVLQEIKFKTEPAKGCDTLLRKLITTARSLCKTARSRKVQVLGIGVGCAGQVNRKKALIETAPNILCLEGLQLGKVLDRGLGLPTVLENDVRIGLWGEHQAGVAQGCSHVLGVFFGTGVGSAAIINGALYDGASGVGGQVGGLLAQPVGGPEAAQSHGIIDRIAGKSAIAAEAAQMAAKNWAPYLHANIGADLTKIGWGVLAKAIKHGDRRIEEMIAARMQVVGIALSNVVNFLNPELLVLGGGLVEQMPKLVQRELERGLRQHLSPEVSKALRVRRGDLGGQAVALGAALMAAEEFD